MKKKGLMPLWATAIIGLVLFILGAYLAIVFFASTIGLWSGIILAIVGIGMMFIAFVLS